MENEIQLIDFNENKETEIKPKKTRKPRKPKTPVPVVDTEETEETLDETELESLRQQLLCYADKDSSVVTKPVVDNTYELIKGMNSNELKTRLRLAKRKISGKFDNALSEQVLSLTNMAVGSLLDCYEDLESTTSKDVLLKETIKDTLSMSILDSIPPEIKIMGLYGTHLSSAYYNKPKTTSNQVKGIIKIEPKVEVVNTTKLTTKRKSIS